MAVRNCQNLTFTEVNAAINGTAGGSDATWTGNPAGDGDTVNLPAGLGSWTTPITVNKNITIAGRGPGFTGLSNAGYNPALPSSPTNNPYQVIYGGQETTLQNDPLTSQNGLFIFNTNNNALCRLTNVHLHQASILTNSGKLVFVHGMARANAAGTLGFRMDHCQFSYHPSISVSGAGTAAVNGIYVQAGVTESGGTWTEDQSDWTSVTATTVVLRWNTTTKIWEFKDKTSGAVYYSSSTTSPPPANSTNPGDAVLVAVTGTIPIPTINGQGGPNSVTNGTSNNATGKCTRYISRSGFIFGTDGWVTGCMDNTLINIPVGGQGAEITDINHGTAPNSTQTMADSSPAKYGHVSLGTAYNFGGGISNYNDFNGNAITGNGDSDAFYFEDCVNIRMGAWIDVAGGNPLGGGGRYVVRYCTSMGHMGGHGLNESGRNVSTRVKEVYNTLVPHFTSPVDEMNLGYISFRGGSARVFNVRAKGWPAIQRPQSTNNLLGNHGVNFYALSGSSGWMFGPYDGTNYWCKNGKGSQTAFSGQAHSPVHLGEDDGAGNRVGDIYATSSNWPTSGGTVFTVKGTLVNGVWGAPYTLIGLTGSANDWAGFTLRNLFYTQTIPDTTTSGTSNQGTANDWARVGGQMTLSGSLKWPQLAVYKSCTFIDTSTPVSGGTQITFRGGPNPPNNFIFNLDANGNSTDAWELRFIVEPFGCTTIGGGSLMLVNSAALDAQLTDGKKPLLYGSSASLTNPLYPASQVAEGIKTWNWKDAKLFSDSYSFVPKPTAIALDRFFTVTGAVDANTDISPPSTYPSDYYPIGDNTNGNLLVIGAHWDPNAIEGSAHSRVGYSTNTDGTTFAPGAPYPHPLISVTPNSTIVLTVDSPGNLNFGNLNISTTADRTFSISNPTTVPMVVSAITAPTGFSIVLPGGFTLPATLTNQTQTGIICRASPIAAQTYSGNVTVASDAGSGVNTIPCSVTGTTPGTRVMGITGTVNGSAQVGKTLSESFVITNTGNLAFNVSGISDGVNDGVFTYDSTAFAVASGASHTVTVTFTPAAAIAYSRTITVSTSDTGPTVTGTTTIAVTGTGFTTATTKHKRTIIGRRLG